MGDVSLCVPTHYKYDAADDLMIAGERHHPLWDSRRLWSLWEMINFGLGSFWQGLEYLHYHLRQAQFAVTVGKGNDIVDDGQRAIIKNNIEFAMRETAARLLLKETNKACIDLENLLTHPIKYSYHDLYNKLERLRDDLEFGLKNEEFFHYPRDMAKMLHTIDWDWAVTLNKFPSARTDIVSAIDCHAIGHHTASVFHMMRVAELGMRALARERQVSFPRHPLEWGNWQNILEQTESRAKAAIKGMSPGLAKDAALAFYSGAIGQLHAFKDTYRNVVMHVRRSYDELEAIRAIHQVRDFMNGLSARIGEKTRRPIPLSLWP